MPDGRFSLRLLVDVALKRVGWLLLPMLLVPVVVAVGARHMPQRYKASAELLVQDGGDVHVLLEDLQVPWTLKNRLPLIKSLLRSRQVLRGVLQRLDVITETSSPNEVDAALRDFRRRLSVYGQGGGVVRISLMASSPEEAKRGLEEVMRTFIDEMLRPQRQGVEESSSFLQRQLERIRTELTTVEDEIATFKRDHADNLPDAFRLNLDAYMSMRDQLTQAQVRLESALRKKKLFDEALTTVDPVVEQLETKLLDAKAEGLGLASVFTAEHPDVLANAARVEALQAQLRARTGRASSVTVAQLKAWSARRDRSTSSEGRDLLTSDLMEQKRLSSEVSAIRGEMERLEGLLQQSHARVRRHADAELTLNRLMRTAQTKSKVYQSLLLRYEEATVTEALSLLDEGSQIWVVDPPSSPSRSTRPPLVVLVLAGVFAGAALGLLCVLALEWCSDRVRTPAEVEDLLGMPASLSVDGAHLLAGEDA